MVTRTFRVPVASARIAVSKVDRSVDVYAIKSPVFYYFDGVHDVSQYG